jgi:pimeloyl-ACP methyl ester carboxylesterase
VPTRSTGSPRHLEDRHRILALDVRGHGESAWSPAGAYRYADQASDLAGFTAGLGLDKFVLIGTSMGGIIAMAYAAERLLGLVINDIGPDAEAGTQRITQMVGSRPDEFATLEDAMAYRRAQPRGPARAGARCIAAGHQRQMGVEDGPGLYRAAGHARRPDAAPVMAGIAGLALPHSGGVGHRQRRAF